MKPYPEHCLRGISNTDFVNEDFKPKAHLFYFYDRDARDDGKIEQSITWNDDPPKSIDVLFSQKKKNGDIQFQVGAVKLPLSEISRINQLPGVNGAITYERDPIDGNDYHGNLLIPMDTDLDKRKAISGALKLAVEGDIIKNPNFC